MRCCVPFCRNTTDNVSTTEGQGTCEETSFHRFPSEMHLRAAWLRALGKQADLPDSAVVCSQHFLNDDIIYETESGVRQIRTGAIPSAVQVCMICLDTDSKLLLMSKHKLEEAYENLTGQPVCDQGNLKQTLCVQCAQRLMNFSRFRDKSLRARALTMELVEKHELVTRKDIKMINRTKHQLKSNMVLTTLGPDHCDLHIDVDLLKSKSVPFQCTFCLEEFDHEHVYIQHTCLHLQESDSEAECETSQVCSPRAAGSSSSAHSSLVTENKQSDPSPSGHSAQTLDTVQAEMTSPSVTKMITSDPQLDLMKAQEETPASKKPLVKINFVKTCKKNLADMTRDELEEFCILKIVEGVEDRSNLSGIKSQFKAITLNIEEFKKKAAALTKQNRDLLIVLKAVQEEQKKKSNMPITPLKITRSVGMQVLMTDKVDLRKKSQNPNTAKNNAAANSGANRQVKPAQNNIELQKLLTNTTPNLPIPVLRLVPAINNSNMNNIKIQPSPENTPGKSQVTGPVNKSPVPNVSNGLPAIPLIPKPEKRPHSRMQQNDSVTVDLTDDERENPRKVYIPISGSQSPVGVRPGQTIMLRTISPPGPRQRVPTPGVAKPNQSPNAVRMQLVPSLHPAPFPESVKQDQPQNWKALPPAPELKLSKLKNGIVISWKIDGYQEETYEEIASYHLYAYQETMSPPSTALWKKIGDVKAVALPMTCTVTQFMAGYKYYFAARAVDIRSRLGPFSLPGSILF
ncbi:uncharacterized protein [Maniola hyperantus]|uniref:uncharacterized protein isoform X3 n=1 Tax=Aphantopus hyperantus TaxID=2795564 RepID=UPI0021433878